FGYQRKAQGLH
ncbi:hypothetical protein KIPB_003953, partial [Kipferlia bialata]